MENLSNLTQMVNGRQMLPDGVATVDIERPCCDCGKKITVRRQCLNGVEYGYARVPSVHCPECMARAKETELAKRENDRLEAVAEKRIDNVFDWCPPPRYAKSTFLTFNPKKQPTDVVAAGKALKLAQELASGKIKGLLIIGPPGTGKTHLAAALYNQLYSEWKPRETHRPGARFIRENDFFSDIKASYKKNSDDSESEILKRYIYSAHCLILDDLCKYDSGDGSFRSRIYYEFFDSIYGLGPDYAPRLMVTANYTPQVLIESLGRPTVDRLRELCTLVELKGVSQRGK